MSSNKGYNNSKDKKEHLLVQAVNTDKDKFPDLDGVRSITLKEGPLSRKEAKYVTVVNRHTGEVHHYYLNIKTYKKLQGNWQEDEEHSVTLSTEEGELQKLKEFIDYVVDGPDLTESGQYLVRKESEVDEQEKRVHEFLTSVSEEDQIEMLAKLVKISTENPSLFDTLLERAAEDPKLFADAAAALNLATYQNAVEELRGLINDSDRVSESQFQGLLTEHPWMFGSEYSELLDRRTWTRDEQQDFVLRRTTDEYIELVEIKTTLNGGTLFHYDSSHKSFYASSDLSKVVGQVQNYIEKLDAERNSIRANDNEDTAKIRAKIIIGRDIDEDQCLALRRFNGHLHRIEVITFDQLLKVAERVLTYLRSITKVPIDEY